MARKTAIERFLARLYLGPNGCWLFVGTMSDKGYAPFYYEGHQGYGHRFAYEHYVGPIPEHLELDHLCRNRACVNPAHLEAVTAKVNVNRGLALTRLLERKAAVRFCPSGHEYSKDNTLHYRGRRFCIQCKRRANRVNYANKKALAAADAATSV